MATFILNIFLFIRYLKGFFHSFTHSRTQRRHTAMQRAGLIIGSNLGFRILSKTTLTCEQEVNCDSLCLLSHCWNYNVATNIQLVWRKVDCASWQVWVPILAQTDLQRLSEPPCVYKYTSVNCCRGGRGDVDHTTCFHSWVRELISHHSVHYWFRTSWHQTVCTYWV